MKTTKLAVILFSVVIVVLLGTTFSYKHQSELLEQQLATANQRIVTLEQALGRPIKLEKISASPQSLYRVEGPNIPQPPPLVFQHGIAHDEDNTIITYGNFRGRPLQMVLSEKSSKVTIRIDTTTANFEWFKTATDDETLIFLKQEVERLVSSNGPTKLGDSGISFVFKGKFPVWGPHVSSWGMKKEYRCQYFGDHATLRDGILEVWGTDTKVGYYPYTLAQAN